MARLLRRNSAIKYSNSIIKAVLLLPSALVLSLAAQADTPVPDQSAEIDISDEISNDIGNTLSQELARDIETDIREETSAEITTGQLESSVVETSAVVAAPVIAPPVFVAPTPVAVSVSAPMLAGSAPPKEEAEEEIEIE